MKCPLCGQLSDQDEQWKWCTTCRGIKIEEMKATAHLYQSADKRAEREAEFNKDT